MHVFFDQQIFVSQEHGGISRYFTELAAALAQAGDRVRVFGGATANRYLIGAGRRTGLETCFIRRRDRLRINTLVSRLSKLWGRWDFAQLRGRSTALVYHATNYAVDPWIAQRADATFLTVFDMIGEMLGDEPSRARSLSAKRQGLQFATGILCISEQTKRDFAALLPECASKAEVTLLAAGLPDPSPAERAEADQLAPYLLFVGKRGGYKNGETALRAFAALAGQNKQLRLVCVGGEPFRPEEDALIQDAAVRNRVVRMEGEDGLLAALYLKATGLLYPSRAEGFGLPVLEAMHLGCPVLTTRCASLPEVAGDAAVYLDPGQVEAWTAAARRLLQDEAWRQQWITAGKRRASQFSWKTTAARTRAAYEQSLAAGKGESQAGVRPGLQACSGANRS